MILFRYFEGKASFQTVSQNAPELLQSCVGITWPLHRRGTVSFLFTGWGPEIAVCLGTCRVDWTCRHVVSGYCISPGLLPARAHHCLQFFTQGPRPRTPSPSGWLG